MNNYIKAFLAWPIFQFLTTFVWAALVGGRAAELMMIIGIYIGVIAAIIHPVYMWLRRNHIQNTLVDCIAVSGLTLAFASIAVMIAARSFIEGQFDFMAVAVAPTMASSLIIARLLKRNAKSTRDCNF